MAKTLEKIIIYSRGENRDLEGNPYLAWRAILVYNYVSYFRHIEVQDNATWGSSGERDCLRDALIGIKEALGIDIDMSDGRIKHHHKTVYRMEDLEHPENWKIEIE